MSRYRIYLSDVSYFSGKLEGALRAKRIPYERRNITPNILLNEVLPNTGWMKVPAVRRNDGLWLCDTTPLLQWLDAEHPERRLIPDDPVTAFLSLLVEDYCDEWQWRPAMFWRWAWPDNAQYLGTRLGEELSHDSWQPAWAMGFYFRRRQQRIYLGGDGVLDENREAIGGLYFRALEWLETLLRQRPYLLGERPSLVDIAWFGPMFRHYGQDPKPAAEMVARAPAVWAWLARVWQSGETEWSAAPLDRFTDAGWNPIFEDVVNSYLPYLHDNAAAVAAGRRTFTGSYGGIRYGTLPAVRYRARCLATLQTEWHKLSPALKQEVSARTTGPALAEALEKPHPLVGCPPIASALASAPHNLGWRQKMRRYLLGTPWDHSDAD